MKEWVGKLCHNLFFTLSVPLLSYANKQDGGHEERKDTVETRRIIMNNNE